jgi:tRNA threonylcarbamoyladenosine biosynthesis protein TsaE
MNEVDPPSSGLMAQKSDYLPSTSALDEWMKPLAKYCKTHAIQCITLAGPLGSGKTTWVQSFMSAQGYQNAVQSPTFNLLHTHMIDGKTINHFDLYRLDHPDDLLRIGFRDLCAQADCNLIEWPNKAGKHLPRVDLSIVIEPDGKPHTYLITGSKGLLESINTT